MTEQTLEAKPEVETKLAPEKNRHLTQSRLAPWRCGCLSGLVDKFFDIYLHLHSGCIYTRGHLEHG